MNRLHFHMVQVDELKSEEEKKQVVTQYRGWDWTASSRRLQGRHR